MSGRHKKPEKLPRWHPKRIQADRRRDQVWMEAAKSIAQNNPLLDAIRDGRIGAAGRPKKLENMTTPELTKLQHQIAIAKEAKRKEEAASLKAAITAMAREAGFKIGDLIR